MKSLNTILLVLSMLMAITIPLVTVAATTSEDQKPFSADHNETFDLPLGARRQELTTSLRGASRFLASKLRTVMKCNKYPRVCHAKGSPGPDCCKKKCVNVLTDRLNCGKCGKKCKFSEICCKGKCVNPMSNERHCGSCNNKCKKGGSCTYGLCNYA